VNEDLVFWADVYCRPMERFYTTLVLNNFAVKLYSGTFKFCKVMQQHVQG